MAKSAKNIEKSTRLLIERVTDYTKKKGNRYVISKKKGKKVKKYVHNHCVHWIIRKGKPVPTLIDDPKNPGNWYCTICHHSFPKRSDGDDQYIKSTRDTLARVHQMQFWAVRLGGDAEDAEVLQRLRRDLPKFEKISKHILKRISQRNAKDKQKNADSKDPLNFHSDYMYNHR